MRRSHGNGGVLVLLHVLAILSKPPFPPLAMLALEPRSVLMISRKPACPRFCSEQYISFYSPNQGYAPCSRLTQLAFHSRVQLWVNSEVVKQNESSGNSLVLKDSNSHHRAGCAANGRLERPRETGDTWTKRPSFHVWGKGPEHRDARAESRSRCVHNSEPQLPELHLAFVGLEA